MMHGQNPPDFRRHSERRHPGRRLDDLSAASLDADRLLHELQVHQVELEFQNDQLRQARAQVETALKRYAELYDHAPVGYFTLDPDGTIRQLNLAGARLLGGERANLLGKNFREFVAPKECTAFSAFLARIVSSHSQAGCELGLLEGGPGGARRCLQIEAAPDRLGQIFSIVAVDVSEKTKATEELVRSNLELQQYAYIAAHDLQTPLRSINAFAQLLQGEFQNRLGPQADAWIDQMVQHVQRMQNLIHDLLEYSRIDSRGRSFKPVDLVPIFDEVVTACAAAIRDSGATITRDDLPTVMGDRLQLAQVMQNLIDNAIKYRSNALPRIHVSARREADGWTLSVRDNGMGITEKHHQDVFEIFRRLHSQHAYPGTGIGLAICYRVVHHHGGRIWVESEPGKGSVFYFTLPDRPGGR